MTRIVWTLIMILYLVVYVYSAYKTQIDFEPIWGYICTCTFPIIFLIFIRLFNDKSRGQDIEDDQH